MKNNILIVLLLLTYGIQANAQTTATIGESSFGLFGGLNFQNINGKSANGDKLSNSLVTRYRAGINYEIPVAAEFFVRPGLQFITKGTQGPVIFTDILGTHAINRELIMNYLELPIHLVFKPLLGSGHLLLGFGPYFSYCLGGKAKFDGNGKPEDTDLTFKKTVPNNDANNLTYFKRMDIGADFFVGYELRNKISFTLNSQLGLVNINAKSADKTENKNTGFGLSIGYRF